MQDELIKLRSYIEENLRTTNVSGIPYIDLNDNKRSILSRQNVVVFGRRGSGKSTLLKEIGKENQNLININLEDYKNISFPNIVIKLTLLIFENLRDFLKKKPYYKNIFKRRKLINRINVILHEISDYYNEDDIYSGKMVEKIGAESEVKGKIGGALGDATAEAAAKSKENYEITKDREYKFEKLENFKKNNFSYKKLYKDVIEFISVDNPLFIAVDDFYFINPEFQPYIADLLHVLTKEINSYIKIASIKHRSKLYIKDKSSYHGIEIGHDAIEIDLDYSLEDMERLYIFYENLLNEIIRTLNLQIVINDIFGGDGFKQLCLASGGVTRDFLWLFSRCINDIIINPDTKIGKQLINGQAASQISNKLDAIQHDFDSISEKVEQTLQFLKEKVYNEKKRNCFLIRKDESDRYQDIKQIIKYLYDYRLIHLIDKNTSAAPSDGFMYEAYILDIGLYDHVRPRSFTQVEPGNKDDKSRKDDMRSSPRFSYDELSGVLLM